VRKKLIIFGFLPITSKASSDRYHLPIATQIQAIPIARPAHKCATDSVSNPIILNAIIRPYIAVTSTSATKSTINVIIFHLISGFLSIAPRAQAISTPSHQPAHNQAAQMAIHAPIEENKPSVSEARS
jgi:hypothetical protein